ncbi:MAG: Hsp70 family protein [bacterium]|nr:Hsp70 family protein [bacterium]
MPGLPYILQKEVTQRTDIKSQSFVGIDLGTTNCSVACVDPQKLLEGDLAEAVRLINIEQPRLSGRLHSPLLPSVVAQVDIDKWWVGQGARELIRQGNYVRGQNIFYSTKSEMGLGKEPFYPYAASTTYDTPFKVAGALLEALTSAAEAELGAEVKDSAVVTVPASFQSGARKDTQRAAAIAGLVVDENSLLDEPNAALLDYLFTYGKDAAFSIQHPTKILVFDFGGGTCDLSLVQVQMVDGRFAISNLAISRYEKLGGDDIDTAIVEKKLLPQLLDQSGVDRYDLGFGQKKNIVLPQLLSTAEALKMALCDEYRNQISLKGIGNVDRKRVTAAQPTIEVRVGSMTLTLGSPALSLTEFEEILEPFVEEEYLYRREMDFGAATSIFSPVMDILGRADLAPSDVDAVLPVGGSVLIPQITQALKKFFPKSDLLAFPTAEAAQVAVARGAAWHSFLLKGVSKPMIRPIAQENIGLLTRGGGFAVLIPAGTELPYPDDGEHALYSGLMVPKEFMKGVNIVVAADGPDKILATAHLEFDQIPRSGEPIGVKYRLDGNKVLEVEAWLQDRPDVSCNVSLENPLSATAVTDEAEQRILELEQRVGQLVKGGSKADLATAMVELGDLNRGTERNEKAVSWYQNALRVRNEPDAWVLNSIAGCYVALQAGERAEKAYREAVKASPESGGLRFNLSLHLADAGRPEKALAEADRACEISGAQPVYRAWKGILLQKLGREKAGKAELEKALEEFEYLEGDDEWSLHWQRRTYLALGQEGKADAIAKKLASVKGTVKLPYVPEDLPGQQLGKPVKR